MEHIYDLVIIGGGAAGYTAALYGARGGLDTLVLEKLSAGGQMALTSVIDNYPGFDEGIDGFTLSEKMKSGAERYGAKSEFGEVVTAELSSDIKVVKTAKKAYYSKTVIIATGADPRKLNIEGEAEFSGRGVHYCAHCDGRFYKGKAVAVIGGGNSAVGDALYLSGLAKKVYLIHRRDDLRADAIYREQLERCGNVEFLWNCVTEKINTDGDKVVGVNIRDVKSGEERDILCNGVFISIGRVPITDFLGGQVICDLGGYIIAGETCETNLKGVFAAGDVRKKPLRQIVTATADGAVAAHFAGEAARGSGRKNDGV